MQVPFDYVKLFSYLTLDYYSKDFYAYLQDYLNKWSEL